MVPRKSPTTAARFLVAAIVLAVLGRYALGYRPSPTKDSQREPHVQERVSGGVREEIKSELESEPSPSVPRADDLTLHFAEDDEDISDDEETEPSSSSELAISGDESPPNALPRTSSSIVPPTVRATTTQSDLEGDDAATAKGQSDGKQNLLTALQQASQPEAPSGMISGVRSSVAAPSVPSGRVAVPEVVASPTPAPTVPWMVGQARGYTMLYAMQPQARAVVEAQMKTLLESRIREPYIGILIDGTFGQDLEYVRTAIDRLSVDGRRLTLALYLSNGPTMRDYDKTSIDALFSRIEPESFRYRIIEESELQNKYAVVVEQARQLFVYNKQVNQANTNVAVVMLEDNLTSDSYRVMRDIVRDRLNGVEVTIVRNPCVGCYDGNDGDTLGDPSEEHRIERFGLLRQGDGFSLDGTGFNYPGEESGSGLSSASLLELMRDSVQRRLRYVGLWRFGWQGVSPGGAKQHPTMRTYEPSSEAQQDFEIEVLREGLSEESTAER